MSVGFEPVALAMVLCDAVHVDPSSGKRTLLGTFSALYADRFPATHLRMAIYICLTECRGHVPLTFRIVDTNEERAPIFETSETLFLSGPLDISEVDIQIGGLTFPEPGEYRVQVLSNDEPLVERRLLVIPIAVPTRAPEGG